MPGPQIYFSQRALSMPGRSDYHKTQDRLISPTCPPEPLPAPWRERGALDMPTEPITLTPGRLIATVLYLLAYPVLILGLGGDRRWAEGWIFSIWFVSFCIATIVYLYYNDPALLAERYRRPGKGSGEQSWDRYFIYAIGILFMAWFVVMPLDARRFDWSPDFPLWLVLTGAALLGAATFFMFRAYTDNTFLSPLVRIQSERQQRVVSTGVYGIVRHPMYLGAICLMLGAPLFLSSLAGLALAGLMIALVIARIVGEEKVLLSGLEGYQDYRNKVKYRLIPHIW